MINRCPEFQSTKLIVINLLYNIFGGFDDDGGGIQSAFDSGRSGTSFGGAGYETSTGEAMVAKGGLMDKDKLAKQMKQSGLASKK